MAHRRRHHHHGQGAPHHPEALRRMKAEGGAQPTDGNFFDWVGHNLFNGERAAPAHQEAPAPQKAGKQRQKTHAADASPPVHGGKVGDGTAVFDHRSGSILVRGQQLAAVSGKGGGRNNSDMEGANNLGPIPRGDWKLGPPVMHHFHMADGTWDHRIGMSLTPVNGTNPKNRTSLVVHEAHGSATNGCVGLSKAGMNAMIEAYNHGVRQLHVTPDARSIGLNLSPMAPPVGTGHYHNDGQYRHADAGPKQRHGGGGGPQAHASGAGFHFPF